MINSDKIYTISSKNLELSVEKPYDTWIFNITITKTKNSPEPNLQEILKNISQSNISEKFKNLFVNILEVEAKNIKINKTKLLKISELEMWKYFKITEEDDVFTTGDDFEGWIYV